ncbi:transposase, partial [Aliivibrio fischeri]
LECKRQGVVPRTLTEELILTAKELICRLIEQIPDKHFKMIRYYGFLSNRRRGEALPKVYDALEMESQRYLAMQAC